MFSEFYTNLKDRRDRDIPDRSPEDLISLFNSAIDHCAEIVLESSLEDTCFPYDEKIDSSPANINKMAGRIRNLKLPELIVHESGTWKNLVDQVLVYLDKIFVSGFEPSVTLSSVQRCLAKRYRQIWRWEISDHLFNGASF